MDIQSVLDRLVRLEEKRKPAPPVRYTLRFEGDPAPITGPCIKLTWGPETDDTESVT